MSESLIEKAGVIHNDIRLVNLFYSISYANSSRSSSLDSKFTLKNKVIDWDDRQFVSEVIKIQRLDDNRFPITTHATTEVLKFFIEYIRKEINE